MQNLQRVTIEFVQTEDRFRMTGADENDRTLLLWFTQRLLSGIRGWADLEIVH